MTLRCQFARVLGDPRTQCVVQRAGESQHLHVNELGQRWRTVAVHLGYPAEQAALDAYSEVVADKEARGASFTNGDHVRGVRRAIEAALLHTGQAIQAEEG